MKAIVLTLAVTTLSFAVSCSREEPPASAPVESSTAQVRNDTVADSSTSIPPAEVSVAPTTPAVLPAPGLTGESPIAEAQRIHDSLMAESSLAPLANTVHVSKASTGHVVLEGTVTTEEEKQRVGEIAERIAGAGNVDNELEIK